MNSKSIKELFKDTWRDTTFRFKGLVKDRMIPYIIGHKWRTGIVTFMVIVLIGLISLNARINAANKRIALLEKQCELRKEYENKLYADLSSEIAFLTSGLESIKGTLIVLKEDNFDVKVYQIDSLYTIAEQIAKDKVTKDASTGESAAIIANTIYLNAKKYSEKYGIPLHVLYTLMQTESSFNFEAKNPISQEYGRGLLQVSDIALKEYNNNHTDKISTKQLETSIRSNMEVGCWYYKRIYEHYNKNKPNMTWKDIYGAYNVGYSDFIKYKDSMYKGKFKGKKYTALKNWDKNFKEMKEKFFDETNI